MFVLPLRLPVKLFHYLAEIVFAHANDSQLARRVLFRIARMRGIHHDGLAELADEMTEIAKGETIGFLPYSVLAG